MGSGSLLLFSCLDNAMECVVYGCDGLNKKGFTRPYVLSEHTLVIFGSYCNAQKYQKRNTCPEAEYGSSLVFLHLHTGMWRPSAGTVCLHVHGRNVCEVQVRRHTYTSLSLVTYISMTPRDDMFCVLQVRI